MNMLFKPYYEGIIVKMLSAHFTNTEQIINTQPYHPFFPAVYSEAVTELERDTLRKYCYECSAVEMS